MLYDTTADVIRKALRGLDMAPSQAAELCGLPEREVLAASRGPVSGEILEALGPALGLNGKALAGLPDYKPDKPSIDSIIRLELPFDDETVNAWLVDAGWGEVILFDTGDGAEDARSYLEDLPRFYPRGAGDQQFDVFITHNHGDHTGGIPGLKSITRNLRGPGRANSLQGGDQVTCSKLTIRAIDLPGHCERALGYVIDGFPVPVCVTGDALFAGSMGGCAPGEPYRQALEALRREVMTLPDETILLPGHGPATTVGSERKSNPFLAE
jgi:glyoxylase-like metal-dependent hydrolase (beta-lactamase superfamily II)